MNKHILKTCLNIVVIVSLIAYVIFHANGYYSYWWNFANNIGLVISCFNNIKISKKTYLYWTVIVSLIISAIYHVNGYDSYLWNFINNIGILICLFASIYNIHVTVNINHDAIINNDNSNTDK